MPLHVKLAFIYHVESDLPGARDATKAFVDFAEHHSSGQLALRAEFIPVDFGPGHEFFGFWDGSGQSGGTYGPFPLTQDLKKLRDELQPTGMFRVYRHDLTDQWMQKNGKGSLAKPNAFAVTWNFPPPYTAVPWDIWQAQMKNSGEPPENIFIHEYLHQLDNMFKFKGVHNFMQPHQGVDKYDDAFRQLEDGSAVPWQKLHGVLNAHWV